MLFKANINKKGAGLATKLLNGVPNVIELLVSLIINVAHYSAEIIIRIFGNSFSVLSKVVLSYWYRVFCISSFGLIFVSLCICVPWYVGAQFFMLVISLWLCLSFVINYYLPLTLDWLKLNENERKSFKLAVSVCNAVGLVIVLAAALFLYTNYYDYMSPFTVLNVILISIFTWFTITWMNIGVIRNVVLNSDVSCSLYVGWSCIVFAFNGRIRIGVRLIGIEMAVGELTRLGPPFWFIVEVNAGGVAREVLVEVVTVFARRTPLVFDSRGIVTDRSRFNQQTVKANNVIDVTTRHREMTAAWNTPVYSENEIRQCLFYFSKHQNDRSKNNTHMSWAKLSAYMLNHHGILCDLINHPYEFNMTETQSKDLKTTFAKIRELTRISDTPVLYKAMFDLALKERHKNQPTEQLSTAVNLCANLLTVKQNHQLYGNLLVVKGFSGSDTKLHWGDRAFLVENLGGFDGLSINHKNAFSGSLVSSQDKLTHTPRLQNIIENATKKCPNASYVHVTHRNFIPFMAWNLETFPCKDVVVFDSSALTCVTEDDVMELATQQQNNRNEIGCEDLMNKQVQQAINNKVMPADIIHDENRKKITWVVHSRGFENNEKMLNKSIKNA